MDSGPAEITCLTATACNRAAGFSALAASGVNERDQSYASENDQAQIRPSLARFLQHLPFPPACSLLETRPGWRLAYPVGEDKAAILPSMAPNNRHVR